MYRFTCADTATTSSGVSGKTTLTLTAIAQAQKNGGLAAFVDVEHALDPQYAKKLGVNMDNLLVSQPLGAMLSLRCLHLPFSGCNLE